MLRISALVALAFVPALALACSSASTSNNATGDDADSGTADAGGGDDGSATDGGPHGDTCEVTKQGKSGLVLQGTVLAPSGVIDSGEVLVDGDGKIVCADTSCASSSGYEDATVLACPGGVISPGLINGHDHTEYNLKGPLTHGDTRWQHRNGWRTGAGGEQKLPSVSKTSDDKAVAASELRFVLGGATSTNGSGGVDGLLRNLAAYKNKEQLEGLSGTTTFFDTFPLGDSDGTELTSGCGYPSIRSAGSAFAGGAAYTPHVSEGINAAAENEFSCIKDSLIKADTAIIHGVGWTANDADVVAKAGAKVIWSPRTNIDLYGNTAPITLLKNDGVTIALGTDWLASGSMNMLRELACVDSVNQKYFAKAFDDKAIWEMATKNTAIATKFDSQIGSLTPGLFADIAVFSRASGEGYRAVIGAGVEDVLLVLRGGKPLYGEAAILDKLDGSCSALDVCGKKKEVCVDTPNVTLDDITGVADANYPLFFCKNETPKDEPSCVPYRDTYPDGTSATDRDGDGVADSSDDCPDVFNPPRPMDGANQSDADNDGVGDACDAKPLDPQSH